MCGQPHSRVVTIHQVAQLGIEATLAYTYGSQDTPANYTNPACQLLQKGQHKIVHHALHFTGYARHGDYFRPSSVPAVKGDESRGRTYRVFQHCGRFRDLSLTQIVVAHALVAPACEPFPQLLFDIKMTLQRCNVISGRTEAACHKNHVAAGQSHFQHAAQTGLVVADRGLVVEIYANLPKLLGDPGGVGVNDVTKKNLCPGSNQFTRNALGVSHFRLLYMFESDQNRFSSPTSEIVTPLSPSEHESGLSSYAPHAACKGRISLTTEAFFKPFQGLYELLREVGAMVLEQAAHRALIRCGQ